MELYKKRISDLGRIVTGKTPRTSNAENYGGKIPFLTPSDDLSGKFAPKTVKTITELGLSEVRNCLLPSKSVCVSCIGSDLGKVVITNEPTVSNQQFNSIIPTEENDTDFIYYLMTIVGKELNFLSKTSTAVPIINKSTFADYEIEMPSLENQRRIAKVLSSLDNKIELNKRINDNLEQQAQALFKSWFVDFEPFKDGEFVESELGLIPKGWKVQEAQDVFEINIGKTPPRKEQEWFTKNSEDNVWVSIADMGICGMFISDSSEYLTNEAIKRFNIQMIEKDSVLLSFKLTVGRVAIADTRLTTNEAIARFILPQSYYREFIYLYLKQYKYGNLGSTSSIATAVNSKTIKGMKLLIPPSNVISDFSKTAKPLFDKIALLLKESRRLAELRDSLLPRLMSGELKVNDIENSL